MEFPDYTFDPYHQGFPQDASNGQPVFATFEDTFSNDYAFGHQDGVDQAHSWHQAPMQRYLSDPQRASLCNPPQQVLPSIIQPVESLPPVASQHRQESPLSSQELSSCCSAQSPGAETELFTENMPLTPPNMAMFPSFPAPPSFEQFESQPSFFLSGLGGFPAESHLACASMAADVDAVDSVTNEWKASPPMVDFGSPKSSYAFENNQAASVCHHQMDAITRQPSIDHDFKYAPSPALSAAVKEEASLPQHLFFADSMKNGGPYPSPSIRDSDGSDAGIDVASPESGENEDEDDSDEYRPTTSPRRPSTSARRATRSKRNAPKSLEKGSAPNKKARTTSSTQQAATDFSEKQSLPQASPSSGSRTSGGNGVYMCQDCALPFKDATALQSHVKKQHTRPFMCVFRFAGCGSTFASKNEWKRHVMSQHLVLKYWLCDIDVCAHNKNSVATAADTKSSSSSRRNRGRREPPQPQLEPIGPPLPDGAIFNRKDLYTQHIRRMHTPIQVQKAVKASPASSKKASGSASSSSSSSTAAAASQAAKTTAQWDDQVKHLQTAAQRDRCQLPVYMECPARRCPQTFSGADAWDQRMEHVARHLDAAALGREEGVVFGGPGDASLMSWVTRADVAVVRALPGDGGWVLNNPLRAASEGRGVGRKREVIAVPSSSSSAPFTLPMVGASVAGSSRRLSAVAIAPSPLARSEIYVEEGMEDAEGEDE